MSYAPSRTDARLPPIVLAFSPFSVGRELARVTPTSSSAVWPAANRAIYVPLYIPHNVTVVKMFVYNGATVSGNVDVGIYDAAGNRLVSKGSTAQASVSVIQAFDITDTLLAGPAMYYMAVAIDNTTATTTRTAPNNLGSCRHVGILQQASAFPLPSTMTPAACTTSYVPIIGISTRLIVG